MPEYNVDNLLSLVGTPWVEGGRDAKGMDCYGLIVYAYSQLGHELADRWNFAEHRDLWELLGASTVPVPWDVVIADNGERIHVGLVVCGGSEVLHSDRKCGGVVLTRLSRMKPKIRGVARFKKF